jgi:DNA-binding NtrC family response regulator
MPDALTDPRTRGAQVAEAVELLGSSPAIAQIRDGIARIAASDRGVLLTAERGVDVESIARELHAQGRAARPFVGVDCGTDAVDRQLFGTLDGFTPADLEPVCSDSAIAAARGGTLFLQDIGELPAAVQARLVRVARDGEVRIDGQIVATEVRLVASASPEVDADVRDHRLRGDLYRRISAARIDLPSLNARRGDIPAIATRLLDVRSGPDGEPRRTFTDAALALLAALTWPNNLAELRDVVERVASETSDSAIRIEHLLPVLRLDRTSAAFKPSGDLREARLRFEREYIAAVLEHHGWRMAAAAQALGIHRPNLYRKARQLGIPLTRVSD